MKNDTTSDDTENLNCKECVPYIDCMWEYKKTYKDFIDEPKESRQARCKKFDYASGGKPDYCYNTHIMNENYPSNCQSSAGNVCTYVPQSELANSK